MAKLRSWSWLLVTCCILACGGGGLHSRMTTLVARGAYTEALSAARSEGREPELDRHLAELVLEHEARSRDSERRRRAWSELTLAGSAARPVLERLTKAPGPLDRARALAALMQLGDADARASLRELADDPDPELSALGYSALAPERDRARLLLALSWPQSERRRAALARLVQDVPGREVRLALETVLENDPDPAARAAAASALAKQGSDAAPALERARADEEQAVRLAAIAALGQVGHDAELARLGRDLGEVPTPERLASASALLRATHARDELRARDLFERALAASHPGLRARAAVLCRGLAPPACGAELLASRLQLERTAEVKLQLALALGRDDPRARAALGGIARGDDRALAVEAASELAALGDREARALLITSLKDPSEQVRVSALRALARLDDPADLAPWLADQSPSVRAAAAAAVLIT